MVKCSLLIICFFWAPIARSQSLDSIFFNLYTDSLKKGTYNYINVEGRFTDGTYLPLGDKEIRFSCNTGKFNGNSLYIDSGYREEKVRIKAVLIKNPKMCQEVEVYIKKYEENERLPTMDEVLGRPAKDTATKGGRRKKKK